MRTLSFLVCTILLSFSCLAQDDQEAAFNKGVEQLKKENGIIQLRVMN